MVDLDDDFFCTIIEFDGCIGEQELGIWYDGVKRVVIEHWRMSGLRYTGSMNVKTRLILFGVSASVLVRY